MLFHCELSEDGGNNTCPSCLVRSTETSPIVAMEVFIEWDVVSPILAVEDLDVPVHWSLSLRIGFEDSGESLSDFFRDILQIHWMFLDARLKLKGVAIIFVVLEQALDHQKIDRKPYGTSPV